MRYEKTTSRFHPSDPRSDSLTLTLTLIPIHNDSIQLNCTLFIELYSLVLFSFSVSLLWRVLLMLLFLSSTSFLSYLHSYFHLIFIFLFRNMKNFNLCSVSYLSLCKYRTARALLLVRTDSILIISQHHPALEHTVLAYRPDQPLTKISKITSI